MVDELVEHVQHVRGAGLVGVLRAGHSSDLLTEAVVRDDGEVCVPALVGALEQRNGIGCRRQLRHLEGDGRVG